MTSFDRPLRGVAVALFTGAIAIGVAQPEARAQTPERSMSDVAQARELFVKAKDQRDAGDVKGALEKFKAAYALAPTPIVGLELGRTYRMAGLLVEARETFLAVGRMPSTSEETARSADARREATELAEQLAGKIPSVSIVVSGMPGDKVVVTVDGVVVPAAALVAPRLVNPGAHTIVATAGAARDEARIEVREGESKKVELKSTPQDATPPPALGRAPVAPPPTPEPEAPPPAKSHTAGYVLDAVGVVGIAVGAVFITRSVLYTNQASDETNKAGTSMNPTDVKTLKSASSADTSAGSANRIGGIVGLVAGAGLLGAGIYLSLDHGPKTPAQGTRRRSPIAGVELVPLFSQSGGGARMKLAF